MPVTGRERKKSFSNICHLLGNIVSHFQNYLFNLVFIHITKYIFKNPSKKVTYKVKNKSPPPNNHSYFS